MSLELTGNQGTGEGGGPYRKPAGSAETNEEPVLITQDDLIISTRIYCCIDFATKAKVCAFFFFFNLLQKKQLIDQNLFSSHYRDS